MVIKKTGLLSILLLFCVTMLFGQQSEPTLTELIESAIHKDYTLANKELDISLSLLDDKKLKEAFLPRVDISAKYAYLLSSFKLKTDEIKIPQLNIDIPAASNRFTTTTFIGSAGIDASMLLYSGGKIPHLRKAVSEKVKAQTALLEKDKEEIISQVTAAYDQLALLRQIKVVLTESEKRLNENKRTADKAFGYGLITKYDRQKIEVAQAQLASKQAEYEGKKELTLHQLHLLTEIERERLELIEQPLTPFNTKREGEIEDRAELKAFQAAQEAQRYVIKAEKTWIIPKVQAGASLGYLGLQNGKLTSSDPVVPGGSTLNAQFPNLNVLPMMNVGIGFKWDVFDGKQGKRDVEKAGIELRKITNERNEVAEKLELNLAKCETELNIANAQLVVNGRQNVTSENALIQATKEYREGLIKSTELIDAEEDFQNAALGYIKSVYHQRRTAIELLKATGHLTIQSLQ